MLEHDPVERFEDGAAALQSLYEATPDTSPRLQVRLSDVPIDLGYADTLPVAPATARHWPRSTRVVAGLATLVVAGALAAPLRSGAVRKVFSSLPPAPPGMALIDVGAIDVGRDDAEIDRECAEIGPKCKRYGMLHEFPRTSVTVAPFFIDIHEVTSERFVAFLNDSTATLTVVDDEDERVPRFVRRAAGFQPQSVLIDLDDPWGSIELVKGGQFRVRVGHEGQPVNQVSWYGASAFCAWRGARLPTEDEWEAAARGASDRRFPWGNEAPTCAGVAIPNDGSVPMVPGSCPAEVEVRAVGASPMDVTPEGVRDLGGNVSEWTSSVFVAGDRGASMGELPANALRVFRGGSWIRSRRARTSGRIGREPDLVARDLGFRCALSALPRGPFSR